MVQGRQLLIVSIYFLVFVASISIMFFWLFDANRPYLFAVINFFSGTAFTGFVIFKTRAPIAGDDEKYRLLFEQASDYIMVTDFKGNFLDVNEALCRMFGYARSELLTMNISALIDAAQLKETPATFPKAREDKQIFRERLMLKKDGTGVWVEANIKNFMGDRVLVIARDITQRRQIETELRETESKFRSLSEKSMVGVYIIQNDKFQYVNPRLAEIFGYEPNELIQVPVENLIDDEDRQTTNGFIRQRIAGEKDSVHYEVRGRMKDGTQIFIEIFGSVTQYQGQAAIVGTLLDITDKKEAADLIIKEKNFSDLIIQTLPGIFFVSSVTGSYLRWNKNLELIWGYSGDEVLESKPYSLIAEEDKEKVEELVAKLLNEGGIASVKAKALRSDGSKIPLFITGTLFLVDGEVYILGIGIDISQQIRVEEELRMSEQKYRLLFDNNPLPMFMSSNEDYSIIAANTAAINHYGYPESDLLTMNLRDLRPKDEVQLFVDSFLNPTNGPKDMGIWRHCKKDGSLVHVQIIAHDIMYQDMWVRLSLANDITERLKTEEELRNSTANLYSILEVTDIAYVLINKDFEIVSFNSKARELGRKELHRTVVPGDRVDTFVPENEKANWDKLVRLIMKGQHFDHESSYVQPDGCINWYHIKLSAVMDNGNFLGMVLAITDITERKKSDVHRENIALDLLRRNKDLEQFTYIISHNLRAPVANILGICEVLQNSNLSAIERTEFEHALVESAGNLDMVIKDLNHILQETTEVFEKNKMVNLWELVENIRTGIRDIISKENVRIVTDFSEVNQVLTLKTYMHSIFYNLITNSIKFRQTDAAPEIHIKAIRYEGNIVLRFKDNGMGIDLEKNGENLYALYSRFNSQIPGKGMGLFMVKKQVQILGGKIIVASTLGRGTEFRVELPENV